MLFMEVVGKELKLLPAQMGPMALKVGVIVVAIVTTTLVAQPLLSV